MGSLDITQLLLDKAMSGAVMRQELLTQNIANANTPGYQRSDVDFATPLREALAAGESSIQNLSFTPQVDTTGSTRLDGNNVDIDAEMARVTENSSDYQALVELARARLHMLSSAIGAH